jgi:hypothetical protein
MKIISALRHSTQQNYQFKLDRAIQIFQDKQKLKQYITTKPPLQKILQGILHTEDKSEQNHKGTGSIKQQEKKRQIIRE